MNLPIELVNKIIMMNRPTYIYLRLLKSYNRRFHNDFLVKIFNDFYFIKMLFKKYTVDFDEVMSELVDFCFFCRK